jgi:hypothetical protein
LRTKRHLKRNEILSFELSACQESVSSLKNLNNELNVKLEEANATRSCVEHVAICNRCKDFDVNACDEHLIAITKLNDGLGFRKETNNLTSQKTPALNKEKGKAPMAISSQKCHAYIYDRKFSRNAHRSYDHDAFNSHAMFASSSTFVHDRSRPRRIMLCIMCLGKCVMNLLPFTMLAILHLRFYVRMKK